MKTRKSDRLTGKDFSVPKKFILIKTMPHCLFYHPNLPGLYQNGDL